MGRCRNEVAEPRDIPSLALRASVRTPALALPVRRCCPSPADTNPTRKRGNAGMNANGPLP